MRLKSLEGCKLKIGSYPAFHYNAINGGGSGALGETIPGGNQKLKFNPNTFFMPPMNWRTTKFLSMPMLPGLEIRMHLEKLEGTINKSTGIISLDFQSKFIFTIFQVYRFPALIVNTNLTNHIIKKEFQNVESSIIKENGYLTLNGLATISPSGNKLLDIFLGLPNEARALLKCQLTD